MTWYKYKNTVVEVAPCCVVAIICCLVLSRAELSKKLFPRLFAPVLRELCRTRWRSTVQQISQLIARVRNGFIVATQHLGGFFSSCHHSSLDQTPMLVFLCGSVIYWWLQQPASTSWQKYRTQNSLSLGVYPSQNHFSSSFWSEINVSFTVLLHWFAATRLANRWQGANEQPTLMKWPLSSRHSRVVPRVSLGYNPKFRFRFPPFLCQTVRFEVTER